jgi:PAS domain S-box-containing protein
MQEASGKHLSEVFNIINEKTRMRCVNPVERVLETGLIVGLANHTALIRKDGTEIIIEDSAAPIRDKTSTTSGVVLVFRDVTDKKRMEEELLKIEKLESVGLLAGGIAHDFNNLLTSIIGNISLAKLYIDSGNKAQERLDEAETATLRATNLTQQLLTFSKGGAPVKKMTSVVDIIRESAGLTLAGSKISPEYAVAEGVWNVAVDPGQMSQVFNNLIINAVHAMPQGGSIRFEVSNVVLAENDVPPLPEGRYVRISVKDSGVGIPKEHLAHIFDPYFTTKKKGSGLGLASVFSIVKRHDGHIAVESQEARGTHFHIYLPASPDAAVSVSPSDATLTHGKGKILVMDDEEMVRDISGAMLRSLGYDAFFAEHGAKAVEMYKAALDTGEPFDAVIMDLTIPGGMGGSEAIGELRAIDADVRAIVSSGYSNDPVMAAYREYGFKAVIIKPYNIKNFSAVLREVVAP